jgi:hypothetical protein
MRLKDVLGSALFLAIPVAVCVGLVALAVDDWWPTMPLEVAGLAVGWVAWRLLNGDRFKSNKVPAKFGYAFLFGGVFLGTVLATAPAALEASVLALVAGLLIPGIRSILVNVWVRG